jgi:hypothetical protein
MGKGTGTPGGSGGAAPARAGRTRTTTPLRIPAGSSNPMVSGHLGALIVDLNPYANNLEPHRGEVTGPVDIYLRQPPSWPSPTPGVGYPTGKPDQVQVEMESNYPAEWTFKGQPQKVYKTVRIKYRYPVLAGPNSTTVLYWVEDYMLIGYEGGPG